MKIDSLEAVRLGDTTQWIHLLGEDPSNPVLLLIQQGPGLPLINEIRRFESGVHRRLLGSAWLRSFIARAGRSK